MKTRIFSLLIMGGAIAFAACQGSGDGTTDNSDTTSIQSSPDNTTVDANKTDTMSGNTTSTLDDNTQKFVMEAASGGMMEVELGQLAQQKASNQRVKDFGAMMVRDHSKANNDLKTAVSGKATIPSSMEEKHQHHVTELSNKTGAEFDKAYIKMMVDDHEADIKKFEDCSKDSKDQAVKDFATNTLPTLKQHLAEAKSIRDELSKMKK